MPNDRIINVVNSDNPTNRIIIRREEKRQHDDDNDGIDITKYGKTAKTQQIHTNIR